MPGVDDHVSVNDHVSVVVPARNAAALLPDLCAALQRQRPQPVEVLVVDDGSRDGTGDVARSFGARVLRSERRGPYASRNLGWRQATSPLVAFLDVRCRPRDGWLKAVAAVLDDQNVAIAGCDVNTLDGDSVAANAAARQQSFSLRYYLGESSLWPYLPTCNLMTRRWVIERVAGFSEERSGADADFCRRVTAAGLGTVAATSEVMMDWVPRDRVSALLRQFYRYGRSEARLRSQVLGPGDTLPAHATLPHTSARLAAHGVLAAVAAGSARQERLLHEIGALQSAAHALGYRRGCLDAGPRR